jgi:hypothetical protein
MVRLFNPFDEFVLVRAWWAGVPLHESPLAEYVVHRDAPLPALVYGLLNAVGFYDDYLWCLAHPPDPVGRRRVGIGYVSRVPEHWRHIFAPVEADLSDLRADDDEYADELAAGESDEAWLLFDYGDHHTFRFKFHALSSTRASVRAARAALRSVDASLPGCEKSHVVAVLSSTHIEQYPHFDED